MNISYKKKEELKTLITEWLNRNSIDILDQAEVLTGFEKVMYPEAASTPKTPIEKLHLSARAHNPLCSANIMYVEDLVEKNFHRLIKLRNFGLGSFLEVREKLQAKGFKLDEGWKMPGDKQRGWVPDIR